MNQPTTGPTTGPTLPRERRDLLETLAKHRDFLRQTLDGMTRDQIVERSTVSALTLGAIVKHVSAVERMWADFIGRGAEAFAGATPEAYQAEWTVGPDDTPESLLATYAATAAVTDAIVREHPDLDVDHELPDAPWFQPGARWSARRVLVHIIAETSQHSGHADIVREAIDGAKTMG
jgi:uncharacterized damage-inducible protein DinB